MIKHVGKHNSRKIVILYRTVPNEDHMCLITYSDAMPALIHTTVMEALESEMGQQAKEFADALFRKMLGDGRNCLNALHQEGLIKKVPTNQVIVTPTSNSSVRLDELNDILVKMEGGEEAKEKMADLDRNAGIRGTTRQPKDVGEPTMVNTTEAGVLSDVDIAKGLVDQASQMKAEATRLLAEAKRLENEASQLAPKIRTKTNDVKKTKAKVTQ